MVDCKYGDAGLTVVTVLNLWAACFRKYYTSTVYIYIYMHTAVSHVG